MTKHGSPTPEGWRKILHDPFNPQHQKTGSRRSNVAASIRAQCKGFETGHQVRSGNPELGNHNSIQTDPKSPPQLKVMPLSRRQYETQLSKHGLNRLVGAFTVPPGVVCCRMDQWRKIRAGKASRFLENRFVHEYGHLCGYTHPDYRTHGFWPVVRDCFMKKFAVTGGIDILAFRKTPETLFQAFEKALESPVIVEYDGGKHGH